MKTWNIRLVLLHVLPFLHLCACVAVAVAHVQSGWEYLAKADTLMTVPIFALSYHYDHPLLLFGVLGTLWWYFLSWLAALLIARVWKRSTRAAKASTSQSGAKSSTI